MKKLKVFAAPYLVWMAVFIVVPLLMVAYFAFTDEEGHFTLDYIANVGQYTNIFVRSIWLAIIATAVCLVLAYPVSFILSRMKKHHQGTMLMIVMLPMWMNFLLRTMAWQTLLEKNGVINTFLTILHLPNIAIINTPAAIILGMVYNFLPFMVLPIYNTLAKIDDNVINAARDLGADNYQTLTKILLPLSVPGIVSGITMVFVPALTTFVISNLLGGSKILLIGNVIEQEFTKGSNWNLGAGLSIVLMVFILLSMTMIAKYDKDGEGSAF